MLCVLVSIISYDILGSSLAFGFDEAAVKSELVEKNGHVATLKEKLFFSIQLTGHIYLEHLSVLYNRHCIVHNDYQCKVQGSCTLQPKEHLEVT